MRRRFMTVKNDGVKIPFYIEAIEDGVSYSIPTKTTYRIDEGDWIVLESNETSASIEKGSKLYIKGNWSTPTSTYKGFSISGMCKIGGCLNSLGFGEVWEDIDYVFNSQFSYLFYGCETIKEASIIFPTTVEKSCYSYMFKGCTSLVNAPELPATTLVDYCYSYMFEGCINLNYIKMLATDISAVGCMDNWVAGVSPTGTFVKSKDATWDVVGSSGVPTGWTVITDDQESGGGEITFYLSDEVDAPYEMKATSGMTWEQWVNSNFAPTEGVLRDFRTYNMGSYDAIKLYHELAGVDQSIYNTYGTTPILVKSTEQIENGKTYYIY